MGLCSKATNRELPCEQRARVHKPIEKRERERVTNTNVKRASRAAHNNKETKREYLSDYVFRQCSV